MNFDRDTKGRWLGYGCALEAWLPKLLDSTFSHDAVDTLLRAGALWCERKAAAELECLAMRLKNDGHWDEWHMDNCNRWRARAAALRKCAEEVIKL